VLAIGSCDPRPLKKPPFDALLIRRRRQAKIPHTARAKMITAATPAAAPTPALKAIVCVTGLLVSSWPVWLVTLADPVAVVEATSFVDALLAELDVVMLEDSEVEAGVMDDGVPLEALFVAPEGTEVILTVDSSETVVEAIETVPTVDTAADELCVAELSTTDPVLVYCSPTTPMIVCAVPSETWNVPFPVLQSHIPSALSG